MTQIAWDRTACTILVLAGTGFIWLRNGSQGLFDKFEFLL